MLFLSMFAIVLLPYFFGGLITGIFAFRLTEDALSLASCELYKPTPGLLAFISGYFLALLNEYYGFFCSLIALVFENASLYALSWYCAGPGPENLLSKPPVTYNSCIR